jgi:hypothetical protein
MSTKKKEPQQGPPKKRAAAKKPAAAAGGVITDIEHEPVPGPGPAPTPAVITAVAEPEPKTLEMVIADEKAKFALPETVVKQWEEEYGKLEITGPQDVAGYEAVKAAWNYVRSRRTAVEGKGLEIRQRFNAINKAISAEQDRLVDLINPLEKKLLEKKEAWEREDKRLREEAKAREEQRFNDRLRELIGLGMTLVDGYYSIGDTITIDAATMRSFSDEKYMGFLGKVQQKAEEIKAEKDRLDELAREQADANEKEARRLKDQADELDRQKKELADQQRELEKQKREAAKVKQELRMSRLEVVGLVLQADGKQVAYINDEGESSIMLEQLAALDDGQFKRLLEQKKLEVEGLRTRLQQRLDREETERKLLEERIKAIHGKMNAAKLQFDYGKKAFFFKNEFMDHQDTLEELLELSPKELEYYATEIGKQVQEAIAKQLVKEQEKEAAREREERAKLSDSEKLLAYMQELGAVEAPAMTSAFYQDRLHELKGRMQFLLNEYEVIAEREAVPHGG